MIEETERKLAMLLQKVVKENINCKKKNCVIVSKRVSAKCKLQIGDTRKKKQKNNDSIFKHLGNILTEDRMCKTEIRSLIGVAKYAFQKLRRVLRDIYTSLENKENSTELSYLM